MTQDWDELLSQPIARLQPDRTAVDGGWLAVQSLDEMSPRGQEPPVTLPPGDDMLSVRFPPQPEEDIPDAPAPPSLTEQLSLTWAPRRGRRRPAEDAASEPEWPEWSPPGPEEAPPPEPTEARRRGPLQRLIDLLRPSRPEQREESAPPEAVSPRPATPPRPAEAEPPNADDAETETQRREPAPQPSLSDPEAPARPSLGGETSLPLTLAQPPRPDARLQPDHADEIPSPSTSPSPSRPFEASREPPPTEARGIFAFFKRARRAGSPEPQELPRRPGFIPPPAREAPPSPARTLHLPEAPLVYRHQPEPQTIEAEASPLSAVPTYGSDVVAPAASSSESTASTAPEADRTDLLEADDPGEALSPGLQERMEGLLDVPLREVRVFRNVVSQRLTRARGADAVTLGNEVHLAPGQGDASTPSGQALLAHELSHYAAAKQQTAGFARSPIEEETQAQTVESAFLQQPDLAATPPPLAYRAQPAPVAVAPMAGNLDRGPQAFDATPFPSIAGSVGEASTAIPAAPVNRLLGLAGNAGQAGVSEATDTGNRQSDQPGQEEREEEETSLVERVVETVLKRLRRDAAFDHERRGAFHSEIGG